MIDIAKLRQICYKFVDGDVEHLTNNPTQELYIKYEQVDKNDREACVALVRETADFMLKAEDKHYLEELNDIQLSVLVMDYFAYHGAKLGARFPGSDSSATR